MPAFCPTSLLSVCAVDALNAPRITLLQHLFLGWKSHPPSVFRTINPTWGKKSYWKKNPDGRNGWNFMLSDMKTLLKLVENVTKILFLRNMCLAQSLETPPSSVASFWRWPYLSPPAPLSLLTQKVKPITEREKKQEATLKKQCCH